MDIEERLRYILMVMTNDPDLTLGDLARLCNKSRITVQRDVAALKKVGALPDRRMRKERTKWI